MKNRSRRSNNEVETFTFGMRINKALATDFMSIAPRLLPIYPEPSTCCGVVAVNVEAHGVAGAFPIAT